MFDPVVNAIFSIPSISFVPFLIIWFGLFFEARVALVFVMSVFDVLVTVAAGARNIEPSLINVGRSFAAYADTADVELLVRRARLGSREPRPPQPGRESGPGGSLQKTAAINSHRSLHDRRDSSMDFTQPCERRKNAVIGQRFADDINWTAPLLVTM